MEKYAVWLINYWLYGMERVWQQLGRPLHRASATNQILAISTAEIPQDPVWQFASGSESRCAATANCLTTQALSHLQLQLQL
jgi:hypothetical protein